MNPKSVNAGVLQIPVITINLDLNHWEILGILFSNWEVLKWISILVILIASKINSFITLLLQAPYLELAWGRINFPRG